MRALVLLATMTSESERLEVYCDENSTFYFEQSSPSQTLRWISHDARDFHDFTKALSLKGLDFSWA